MLFTYKDKGPATVFAYPSNQRPMSKHDAIQNIPGKPNPIKQWRKQLQPSVGSVVESHPTMQDLENSVRTQGINYSDLCNAYEDIYFINECNGIPNEINDAKCTTGSAHVRRSATTIINKDFCWNSKQYLQRRCKTFDQNQTLGTHVEGSEFYSASCTKDSGNICKPVIHKPNNKQFKQQGGVSSSARIAKLKYDTIVNSTNKYDSLLANLDSSSHILNRKPTPCRGWRVRGKRDKIHSLSCNQTESIMNI
jgi:hypothetical protein